VNPTPLYTRAFWLACAIHFTGGMSLGMFLLFPLFVRFLGGNELTIGLVLGTGLAVSVALRPAVGGLLDRFGRRRVLLWGGVANAASYPLFLLLDGTGAWLFALAALHLVVGGALFASYFTYAADLIPADRRVEGIAIFGIAGMAPNGLGPSLGEVVLAHAGFPAFFLTATAWAVVSVALTRWAREEGGVPHRHRAAGADMVRLVLGGGVFPVLAATVLFGAGVNAAFYFIAPYTRHLGIERAAPFFASYASATILLRAFGRRLPDRVGAHPIAVPAFALFAAGLAVLCLLPLPGALVAAGIACGAGHGSLFPVLNGLVVMRTPPRLHGAVVSLYTAALDGGAVLGTPLCGAIARGAGYRSMFLTMAAASLGGLALMVRDRRRVARAVAAAVLVLVLAGSAPAARWPELESGPLQDNSFLIEEAYNQEAGVVQHIVNAAWDRKSRDWELTFTQEWPVPDETHQLSFTVPYLFAGEPGAKSGAEDVLLNYRYQALMEKEHVPAFAPRLSLLLPTGSARDGLGTGSAGVELSFPLSKQLGRHFSAHLNGATTIVPHALLPHDAALLVSGRGGGSLIWEPFDAINFLCELLASHDEEVEDGRVVERTRVVLDPGVRVAWNAPAGIQFVWGVGLPIGLTPDTEHFAVFLYFSAEHAVTRAAAEKRRW